MDQPIPVRPRKLKGVHDLTLRGKREENWGNKLRPFIARWRLRGNSIASAPPLHGLMSPNHEYMEWYRLRGRRYISRRAARIGRGIDSLEMLYFATTEQQFSSFGLDWVHNEVGRIIGIFREQARVEEPGPPAPPTQTHDEPQLSVDIPRGRQEGLGLGRLRERVPAGPEPIHGPRPRLDIPGWFRPPMISQTYDTQAIYHEPPMPQPHHPVSPMPQPHHPVPPMPQYHAGYDQPGSSSQYNVGYDQPGTSSQYTTGYDQPGTSSQPVYQASPFACASPQVDSTYGGSSSHDYHAWTHADVEDLMADVDFDPASVGEWPTGQQVGVSSSTFIQPQSYDFDLSGPATVPVTDPPIHTATAPLSASHTVPATEATPAPHVVPDPDPEPDPHPHADDAPPGRRRYMPPRKARERRWPPRS